MANNGDKHHHFTVITDRGPETVQGIGSFHKTLPHNPDTGEVCSKPYAKLLKATARRGPSDPGFGAVDKGMARPGDQDVVFINPQAGLASDRLLPDPNTFEMPPAPAVLSKSTAAEMTELYWMALARDVSFDVFETDALIIDAVADLDRVFKVAAKDTADGHLQTGVDLPGGLGKPVAITPQNVFRLGLPGEERGPLVSQFFIRNVGFGTQTIDQSQAPYKAGQNYLTTWKEWLHAQDTGTGHDGRTYNRGNESSPDFYHVEEGVLQKRYIATMRDLARFVNKDALHQAYFNAALLLLNGKAPWTPGNPYSKGGPLESREAGFGNLGGPHILALVSEVATRALKVVWFQKWQENLRLRPEAYGGLVHMQEIGGAQGKRGYGLPLWSDSVVAARIRELNKTANGGEETLLLPMAFTAGSPAHPAYGAGHATVAGACVTVLKAYFETFKVKNKSVEPVKLCTLIEKETPFAAEKPFRTFITKANPDGTGEVIEKEFSDLTIEGELNKLAMNVAMGRTMGGVHWRSDNTRSLQLGEALAAHILADITKDLKTEKPAFTFRTFARLRNGQPKIVTIANGKILVDGVKVKPGASNL